MYFDGELMASNGHLSDILIKVKSAVTANTTLDDALVFKREELTSDELDVSKINVFIYQDSERPHAVPMVSDFRVYRVRVVLAFGNDGRSLAYTADDTVLEYKSLYSDALLTAIKTTNAGQTYAISSVYLVENVSTELDFGKQGQADINGTARIYRISQLWDFYTYEA